jgi:hypothetical protein
VGFQGHYFDHVTPTLELMYPSMFPSVHLCFDVLKQSLHPRINLPHMEVCTS